MNRKEKKGEDSSFCEQKEAKKLYPLASWSNNRRGAKKKRGSFASLRIVSWKEARLCLLERGLACRASRRGGCRDPGGHPDHGADRPVVSGQGLTPVVIWATCPLPRQRLMS